MLFALFLIVCCLIVICFVSYIMLSHFYLICVFSSLLWSNCSFYVFIIRFIFFLFFYVLLSILCSVLFCIFFLHLYSCCFSICVQVYWPLPPGGKPVAVNKYRIISIIMFPAELGLLIIQPYFKEISAFSNCSNREIFILKFSLSFSKRMLVYILPK